MATVFLINDDTPRKQYVATAAQTLFPYPFLIFEDVDLKVYLTPVGQPSNPIADLLALNTNYTVTGVGLIDGGNVILTVPATVGDIITIERDIAFERKTDFKASGAFTSAAMNNELDRLVMMCQQVQSLLFNRGLLYQVTDFLEERDNNNIMPKLAPKTGNLIPILSKNADDELIATAIEENIDASTLRTDLASEDPISPGSEIVGHYDSVNMIARTVQEQLDFLSSQLAPGTNPTGTYRYTISLVADMGWVIMDDGTIGNASSGASNRADPDTEALFILLWNSTDDTNCPVLPGGRGASAQADFDADKTINLPISKGRGLLNSTNFTSAENGSLLGNSTATLVEANLPAHSHGVTDAGHRHDVGSTNVSGGNPSLARMGSGAPINNTPSQFSLTNIVIDPTGSDTPFSIQSPATIGTLQIKL